MSYCMVTIQDVALCETEDSLWNAVNYRSQQPCFIYKADDMEELNMVARLRYNSLTQLNIDTNFELLMLPEIGTQGYALTGRMSSSTALAENNSICYGFWAVSGLNGFVTVATINEMIGMMRTESLIHPVAIWAGTVENAKRLGRREYVKRFFDHFDGRVEKPSLPCKEITEFFDMYFIQREERRACMGAQAKAFMNTMVERGW